MSTLKETISAPTALQGKDQGATNSQVDAATRHHPATEEKVEAEMPSTAESPDETEHATGKSKDPTAPTRNIETVGLVVEKAEADFKLMPITLDEVRPNEVLVEMKYSGICHTDLVVQAGKMPQTKFPAVLGHEGAGVVRAIGADVANKSLNVGDHVLLSFAACRECYQCRTGHPAACHLSSEVNIPATRWGDHTQPGKLSDGRGVSTQFFGQSSFAKMSIVNETTVVKCDYPKDLPNYVSMGCGFQTGAGTILNILKPRKDEPVVVFGLGGVGLSALMAAHYLGVKLIIGVDLVDDKLQWAKTLGATHTINPKQEANVAEAIQKITGEGAHYAVECSGNLKVLQSCVDCIRPGGTVMSVGLPPPPPDGKVTLDALPMVVLNKTYKGALLGDSVPSETIPKLVEMHQKGQFPVDKLVRVYPIDQIDQALRDMHDGKVFKPVLDWSTA